MVQAWARAGRECFLWTERKLPEFLEHTTPVTFPEDETFDIGLDTRTGVALLEYRYNSPFKFTGKLNKLTFEVDPEPKEAPGPRQNAGPTAAPSRILSKHRSTSGAGH